MLLAFDDTDGPVGGCTTHLAFHVLLALPELALTGMPRLVRLNPNVPWKTRGNGAVVLPLGIPRGPQVRVGELRGSEILAFPEAAPVQPSQDVIDRVWAVLAAQAQPGASPGVALFADAPPQAAYWETVRAFVEPASAKAALADLDVLHHAKGDGRALVGCLGAAAWAGPPSSYEVIAYREPARWGTARAVEPGPLFGLDASGATFHTEDPVAKRLACVPHTPDPVLIGLRGRDPERLRDAALRVLPLALREPVDGWLLWATNHASGDHVTPVADLSQSPPLGTLALEATVTATAERRQGGHAFVPLRDAAGAAFEAVAFEPTHAFRDALGALLPGDRLAVVGAFHEGVLRLEKLRIVSAAVQTIRRNPDCRRCGRRMRSKGPSTGFRCDACKEKMPSTAAVVEEVARRVDRAWHEPPVMARRHLHRPVAWG
ncbi:MAG: tRNA(Ile)(2)-agmatinylcytidine synthase [Candidatus Thermoplasmatota archaeon]